jgi:SAM-dependent methyltransferase
MNPSPSSQPICPSCGRQGSIAFEGRAWRITPGGREFRYGECSDCQLLFCHPTPTEEEIRQIYGSYYTYAWFSQRHLLKKTQAAHRYSRLRRLFRVNSWPWTRGRFLDVGCGHGWLLSHALNDGWDTYGIDLLDDKESAPSEALRMNIRRGSLEDGTFPDNYFDIVTAWHVLEHFRNPAATLNIISKAMTVGGYCAIAVPNRGSKALQRAGVNWGWLQEPFVHVSCMSIESIRRMLPDGMTVAHVASRDTWDQQYAMTTLPIRAIQIVLRFAYQGARRVFGTLGMERTARFSNRVYVLLSELVCLATYAGYLVARPLLRNYEKDLRGCELLVILRKA